MNDWFWLLWFKSIFSRRSGAIGKQPTNNWKEWFSQICSGIPREIQQYEFHGEKVTWWGASQTNVVVDTYFVNIETVRWVDYYKMMDMYVRSEAQQLPRNAFSMWHWALSYMSWAVRPLLEEMFPNSGIGRYGISGWPPASPEITVLVFPLYGFVKDVVYRASVHNLSQTKGKITTTIWTVNQKILNISWISLEIWLHSVIQENGGHIGHQWHLIRTSLLERYWDTKKSVILISLWDISKIQSNL